MLGKDAKRVNVGQFPSFTRCGGDLSSDVSDMDVPPWTAGEEISPGVCSANSEFRLDKDVKSK